jgi:hypothetical protein
MLEGIHSVAAYYTLSGNFGDQHLEQGGHTSSIIQCISEFVHNLFFILCKKKRQQ